MVTIMVFQKIIIKRWNKLLVKKLRTFENADLQRVPLFIHVPGMEGGVNHDLWWTN